MVKSKFFLICHSLLPKYLLAISINFYRDLVFMEYFYIFRGCVVLKQLGGEVEGGSSLHPPLTTNETKISYPKPLKHSNKTKLRLNEEQFFKYIFPYH